MKNTPTDAYDAFYEGFNMEDNPFSEFDENFDKWEQDYIECATDYKRDGRFRTTTFIG